MIECSKCKKQLEDGTAFCDQCGTPLAAGDQPALIPPEENTVKEEGAATTPKAGGIAVFGKTIAKKWIIMAGAGVLATIVLFAVIVAAIVSSLGGISDYTLYFKDGQVFYSDFSSDGTWQLSNKLIDNMDGVTDSQLASASSTFGVYFHMTDDGVLFYPDRLESDGGFSVYYKNVKRPDSDPVKVDSEISLYFVSEDGKIVTYAKGEDSVLYQYNTKKEEKEKIASGIEDYIVSEDGKVIFFMDEENGIYVKKYGKEKEKLESDVDTVCFINSELDTIYYIKEDNLYKKELGKERVKIASDVNEDNINVYESGEVYYFKSPESLEVLGDVDNYISSNARELYYYNGKESVKVCDNATGFTASEQAAVGVYSIMRDDKAVNYVVVGQEVTEIEEEMVSYIRIADNGKTIYFMVPSNEEQSYADLYQIKISKSTASKPTLYDTDVYTSSMKFFDDDNFAYFKDYKSIGGDYSYIGKADLYVNKERVDYDVYTSSVKYVEESGDIVYFTDWNSEKSYGTLKVYDGEAKKIKDDVHSFNISADGDILYIADFSTKYYKGDLYRYNGKKSERIDVDVNGIIRVISIYEYYR